MVSKIARTAFDADGLANAIEALFSLYSRPYAAAAREYVANALDAHRAAGYGGPVVVSIEEGRGRIVLRVTDYGLGMDHATLTGVYLNYHGSEKAGDEDQIGGFGIGAKSGLAVGGVDVVSCHKGQTTGLSLHYDGRDIIGAVVGDVADRGVDGTTVTLTMQTRDPRHTAEILDMLRLIQTSEEVLTLTHEVYTSAEDRNPRVHEYAPRNAPLLTDLAARFDGRAVALRHHRAMPDQPTVLVAGLPYRVEGEARATVRTYNLHGLLPVITFDRQRHAIPRSRETIIGVEKSDLADPLREVNGLLDEHFAEAGTDLVKNYTAARSLAGAAFDNPLDKAALHFAAVSRSRESRKMLSPTGEYLTGYTYQMVAMRGESLTELEQHTMITDPPTTDYIALVPGKVPLSPTAAMRLAAERIRAQNSHGWASLAVIYDRNLALYLARNRGLRDGLAGATSSPVPVQEVTDADLAARRGGVAAKTYPGYPVEIGEDGYLTSGDEVRLTLTQWREKMADPNVVVLSDSAEARAVEVVSRTVDTCLGPVAVDHSPTRLLTDYADEVLVARPGPGSLRRGKVAESRRAVVDRALADAAGEPLDLRDVTSRMLARLPMMNEARLLHRRLGDGGREGLSPRARALLSLSLRPVPPYDAEITVPLADNPESEDDAVIRALLSAAASLSAAPARYGAEPLAATLTSLDAALAVSPRDFAAAAEMLSD